MATALDRAVAAMSRGGLVVYPTDTLLGIGATAENPKAVHRLVELKGRPSGMPISLAISSVEEIEEYALLSKACRSWLRLKLPGPWTVLLRSTPAARRRLAGPVVSPSGVIGIRVPDHPIARALAQLSGPITATSANRHGEPPSRTVAEARRKFGRAVTAYLPAVPPPSGVPSMLVDWTREQPRFIDRSRRG